MPSVRSLAAHPPVFPLCSRRRRPRNRRALVRIRWVPVRDRRVVVDAMGTGIPPLRAPHASGREAAERAAQQASAERWLIYLDRERRPPCAATNSVKIKIIQLSLETRLSIYIPQEDACKYRQLVYLG